VPRNLPQNYLDTLAATSLERWPSCKVEVYFGGDWQDISAFVAGVSVTHTMEQRGGEARVRVADPNLDYQRFLGDVDFWSAGSADSPLREGHRIRISITNAPASLIQVFQGYIRETSETIERGAARVIELGCVDAGWKAYEQEITMGARVYTDPAYGDAVTRQVNTIIRAILKHPNVGFADEDIILVDDGAYALLEWKPSTFTPTQAIGNLLDCIGARLRFDHAGKAVSCLWNPVGAPAWTYGSLSEQNLIASFEIRSRPPRELANRVTAIGRKWGTGADVIEEVCIGTFMCQYQGWDYGPRERNLYLFAPKDNRLPDDYIELYTDVRCEQVGGHVEDSTGAYYIGVYGGMPPPRAGLVHIGWQGQCYYPEDYVDVRAWGKPIQPTAGAFTATKTVSQLSAHGYIGEVTVENDLFKDNAACEAAATRAATWLMNEMFPCSLTVPCNLCHEPGDKIRVYLPKGSTADDYVDFILVTHRIEYERGKPNVSVLELVPDFAPTIT